MTDKKTDLLEQINRLTEISDDVIFNESNTYFDFTLKNNDSNSVCVITDASIKEHSRKLLVRITTDLDEALDKYTMGTKGVSIVALAEWALKELNKRNETLLIKNKE
ncbi:hypothetical protein O3461_004727 [Salmonella enterica subsp. enterica serovar Infantis]|nr:hypothetical protein [Salmonella enterica subsp. enterica serovar Infantis]ECL3956124.1 hypothetical protein [Salmonella enterica]EDM7532322.1 hypothetical protein [Salmonella enterica subsp. enterica serovar Montevideo]EFU5288943.1 hypothetical protein [Salmonella enterica]EKH5138252.1 hypothetical protein [Salmonella enterica subsp. enterica serovar Infantis]